MQQGSPRAPTNAAGANDAVPLSPIPESTRKSAQISADGRPGGIAGVPSFHLSMSCVKTSCSQQKTQCDCGGCSWGFYEHTIGSGMQV